MIWILMNDLKTRGARTRKNTDVCSLNNSNSSNNSFPWFSAVIHVWLVISIFPWNQQRVAAEPAEWAAIACNDDRWSNSTDNDWSWFPVELWVHFQFVLRRQRRHVSAWSSFPRKFRFCSKIFRFSRVTNAHALSRRFSNCLPYSNVRYRNGGDVR